jgi:type I restriction enzyme S subunit
MFGDPAVNPNHHPVKRLADLGELNRGVSKSRPRNKPELMGGPYPLVQTGEVTAAELYITSYENTYSELGLAQSKMWPKGTLCITIAANIAQTAILGFDSCFPDSVVGFISGKEVTQIYMHYWFSFFQKVLEEQAPQVAQKNINLKILSDLRVMTPSMDLQNQFVDFVNQLDKSKYVAYQLTLFLNKLIKYKLQSLFQEECICSLKM